MKLKLFLTIIALIITGLVIQFLIRAGIFKSIKNESPGLEVSTIDSPPGVEDLDYDPETGTIFLSSHDRRDRTSTGAIYALKANDKSYTPINLTRHLNLSEFRPHGISFANLNGNKLLFVISHKDDKDVVLKFRFQNDSLTLENSYSSTDFSSPNDLFATGENSFLVTNDHGTAQGFLKTISDFLRIPVGNVVHFDNGKSTVVLGKISYPNGVIVKDNEVYVSSTLGNYIGIYKPVSTSFHLEEVQKIKVPHSPDNLMLSGERIYTAGHPKLLAFMKHANSAQSKSPSSVYYIENGIPKEIFLNDGTLISGSSTALPLPDSSGKDVVYVGSVFESKILKLMPK